MDWHSLACHSTDGMETALWLWDGFLGARQRSLLADGADLDMARRRIAGLAGLHDFGKASPIFQVSAKNPERAAAVERAGFPLVGASEGSRVPHALLSARFVFHHLTRRGVSVTAATWAALVAGGHHGSFPSSFWHRTGSLQQVGGSTWAEARQEFADELLTQAGVMQGDWENVPSLPGQLATAGLVILADWLASNTNLFRYTNGSTVDYLQHAKHQARDIPAVLDIGRPWRPESAWCTNITTLFDHRWPGKTPRAVQELAHDLARRALGAGLLIIEAPMGDGKSEAALAAAEVIAAKTNADGVFLGLPTQATANQQFGRITRWLSTFETVPTVALAHGKARRQLDYQQMLVRGVSVDHAPDDAAVAALEWLAGGKKALLAHIVVGTVDQLLLAGVAARHVALRHLALAGKVVIVDEVHAYDAYMSAILHRVLAWLGAAGVPVILLSATLASQSRHELVAAYAGATTDVPRDEMRYPRLTWVDAPSRRDVRDVASPVAESCPAARSTTAQVELRDETDGARQGAQWAFDLVKNGGCALIIRNTVARAQRTFTALQKLLPEDEVTLVHAAFTAADRSRRDILMMSAFGPPLSDGTSPGRPDRHVVVATQVLEQSLDVDFDVLISDLAPVDLLLQRLGRVRRHTDRRDRVAGLDTPRMIVIGMTRNVDRPPSFPDGSIAVYGEHLLARTAAVLMSRHPEPIAVPDDVPLLVDAVYGDDQVGPDAWRDAMTELADRHRAKQKQRQEKAHSVLLALPTVESLQQIGYGDNQPPEDGDHTALSHVRLGPPSMEVLLLRRIDDRPWARTVSAGDQHDISLEVAPDAATIEVLLDQAIRLPRRLVKPASDARAVTVPKAWRWSPWLRRLPVLLLDSGDSPTRIGGVRCTYSVSRGLEALGS
jgi:CRISPR-associated helicase Cas3/CRISPR-associated endonuclease Cas3-HD